MKQLFTAGIPIPLLHAGTNHTPHHLIGLLIVAAALCVGFIVGKRYYKRKRVATADTTSEAPNAAMPKQVEEAVSANVAPIARAEEAIDEPTTPAPQEEAATPTVEESKVIDPEFIARARALVMQHLDDADWTIEAFAREMNLSQPVFSNKLRTQTGMLPNDLIREIRMEEACRLIRAGGHDIATISYMVGFSDPKYFTRVFKKQYGVPPSKFREETTE